MPDYTKNLNLEKPLGNESIRRKVINANMDKIDTSSSTEGRAKRL